MVIVTVSEYRVDYSVLFIDMDRGYSIRAFKAGDLSLLCMHPDT